MASSLNIGAGLRPREPGVINSDLYPGPNIDVVFDASKPWPFKTHSIGRLHAIHVLEHLPELTTFFREAHRVVAPSLVSNIYIRLPYGPSEAGYGDVTHLRQYVPTSFACFMPGWNQIARNRQYDEAEQGFVIDKITCIIDRRLRFFLKPIIRRLFVPYLPFLFGAFYEMIIVMHHASINPPQSPQIPLAFAMYENHYKGNETRGNGKLKYF